MTRETPGHRRLQRQANDGLTTPRLLLFAIAEAVCRVLAFAGGLHAGGGWAQRGDVIRATMEPLTVLRQMLRCVEDPRAREMVARDVARASLRRMG